MTTPSGFKIAVFSYFIISALLLCGCGSGSKSAGGTTPSGTDPAATDSAADISQVSFTASLPDPDVLLAGRAMVGTSVCAGCHSIPGSDIQVLKIRKSFDNAPGNVSWLYGPHGNYESLNLSNLTIEDRGPDNTGVPSYGFEGLGTDPSCVTNCHDPLGEGRNIAANYAATGDERIGRVDRPIIGCEACHGGGQNHFGVASVPVARPNAVRCGRCHNAAFPAGHIQHHPEGGSIFEDYAGSGHGKANKAVPYTANTKNIPATCSRCHTDEGAQAYISSVNGTESYSEISAIMAMKQDIGNAAAVQCRTCHDKHNPDTLLGTKASGLPSSWSAEFKTCNSCHQLLKADGSKNTAAFHNPAVNTTEGSVDRIISDTHYDDPATPEIEGYVVDPTSIHKASTGNINSGTCRDCHNPHKADNSKNRQWARSAHGGFIATVKDSSGNGVVTESVAPAWTHYDFKASNYKDCQRCHTSTGFRNMANSPSAYDPIKNQFAASGSQKEMLYCWACHTSNKGDLRNPGQFVLPPSYVMPAGRAFPSNLSGSFICVNCHSGRETGQFLKNNYTDATVKGQSFGSFNSHYLAAGGILYRTVGYEYAGRDYSNPSDFRHDLIGSVIEGTGTNGPCVGCHMKGAESHLFEAAQRNTAGDISAIPALQNVCSNCHGVITNSMSVFTLNTLEKNYNATLGVLKGLFAARGIYYNKGVHPYFYNTPDPGLQTSANAFTSWDKLDTVGAAFNLNLFAHQPGAFAHNSAYTERLLYDSIDFMDDGILNNSVGATLNALPASDPNKQGAIEFLGGGRP